MSAPQFTPGPWDFWFTREPADDYGTNFHVGPISDEYAGIGHTVLEGGLVLDDDNENEANARLIAAAPRMYGALETIANCDFNCAPGQWAMAASELAKQILREARGEQ